MKLKTTVSALAAGVALALSGAAYANGSGGDCDKCYEVWAIDQAHTHDETGGNNVPDSFGGTVYIFTGDDGDFKKGRATEEHFNLKDATTAAGLPDSVKPHMTLWANGGSHLVIGSAGNGTVVAIEGDSRTAVDTTTPGGNSHAAIPSPDGSFVLVSDIGGQTVHKVPTDWNDPTGDVFKDAGTVSLNLSSIAGAIGASSAKPICPIITDDSAYSYVTLAAGGLAIVDNASMTVLHTYTVDEALDQVDADGSGTVEAGGDIGQNGCGGIQIGSTVYINSGTKNPENSDMIYAFDNSMLPAKPDFVRIPQSGNDSHGMLARKKYLWGCNRGSNTCNVHDTTDGNRIVNVVDLQGSKLGDTAPDLVDLSPSGKVMFIAQRGPQPLSANSATFGNAIGDSPGVGVVAIKSGGKRGTPRRHYPITNLDANGLEQADIHSLRVRK